MAPKSSINQKNNKHAFVVGMACALSACILSACGGGSGNGSARGITEDISAPATAGPVSGTVVLEERNGKTVLDAWFVRNESSDNAAHSNTATLADDHCTVESAQFQNMLAAATNASDTSWDHLQPITGHASIDSRVGEYDSLIKQQTGEAIVYAPAERWNRADLPDDAVLSFDEASVYEQIGTVGITPLAPLVWLAPETGFMTSAGENLSWEASPDDAVKINLTLSAIDFEDAENPTLATIKCQLIDDGAFSLTGDMQQQLPDDHSGIVVYAVRERVQQLESDAASLTVVQLSYPSPP